MRVESRVEIEIAALRVVPRDCGLKQFNPQSEIRNPQSPRRGLSLTEVLIAMGILTIGLLSVAAIFPVGSFYMQKAEIADRARPSPNR